MMLGNKSREGSHTVLCLRMCICPLPLYSKSSGSAALLALTWTCLLVRIVFPLKAKRQGDIWNKLVGSLVFGGSMRVTFALNSCVMFKHFLRPKCSHRWKLSQGICLVVGVSAAGITFVCSSMFPSFSGSDVILGIECNDE